jgi:hypothetical protein
LDGDLNGGNDNSPLGGQYNPHSNQMSTPKNTMEKSSVHPIQTSTPKNAMEKNLGGKEMEIEVDKLYKFCKNFIFRMPPQTNNQFRASFCLIIFSNY